MKRTVITLITLSFLATSVVNTAWAKKRKHHAHKAKVSARHTAHVDLPEFIRPVITLNTDSVTSDTLLSFAHSLLGRPYRPASSNPMYGFDCSGFVSYVFKTFNFSVPRSSDEFINAGEKVNIEDAKPGDVILFTGTRSHHPHSIGHVGIVYSNDANGFKFIHSTSGKEYCVTISSMDDTYKRRFVQVVRLLKQNDSGVVLAAQ